MILCDTNILIEFYKNTSNVTQELRHIGPNQLAISVVTQAELYFGALNKGELQKIKHHLSLLHYFPLDTATSNTFLRLMERYTLSHTLNIPDALIASTALVHNVELYTLNKKDFHFISNLRLYQPATY